MLSKNKILFLAFIVMIGTGSARAQTWSAGSSPFIADGSSVTIDAAQPNIVCLTNNGTLTFTAGGSATITGNVTSAIGSGLGASGVLAMSGGAITNKNSGYFVIGYLGGTGTATIASGAILASPSSRIRLAGNEDGQRSQPSYASVSVAGLLTASILEFTAFFPTNLTAPYAESARLTLHAGGILEAGAIQKDDCAASTLVFNGGTLRALQDTSSLFSGSGYLALVIADNTQAIFDTNGKTVIIAPLASPYDSVLTLSGDTHATAVGNGGLIKTGAGALCFCLSAACNTFTGAVEVVQGVLDLGRPLADNQCAIVHNGATLILHSANDASKVSVADGGRVLYAIGSDTTNLNLTAVNTVFYDDRLGSPMTGSATLSGPLTYAASAGTIATPFLLFGQGGTLNLTNTTLENAAIQIDGPGTFNFMGSRTNTSADTGKIVLLNGGFRQDQIFALADPSAATPASFNVSTGRFGAGVSLDVGVGGYGAFTLSGNSATATCGRVCIGGQTGYVGTFDQSTGIVALSSDSYVGLDGGTGTLFLSGGQLLSGGNLFVAANPSSNRFLFPDGFVTVSNALARCNQFYFDAWWPTNGSATNTAAGWLTLQSGGQAEVNQVVKNDDPIGTILFDGGLLRARTGISGLLSVSTANGTLRAVAASNQYTTIDTGANTVSLQGGSGKLMLGGAGGFKKLGNGILTFSATQSSYTGDTVIAAGTLRLGGNNVIPDGAGLGDVQIATNAVLDLFGKSETINRLIGYGSVISTNSPAALGILADGSSDTWDHDWFTGPIAIEKQGAGTLTVAASGIFGTNVTVSSGKLVLSTSEGYPYYRFKIEEVKDYVLANSMQFSEIALYNGDADVTSNRIGIAYDPNGASFPAGETPDKAVDGIVYTNTTTKNKWLDFRASTSYVAAVRDRVWIRIDFPSAQKITRYNWATGNDAPERDPATWRLQGSYNGTDWTDIDVQSNFIATSTRNAWVTTNGFSVSSFNSPDAVTNSATLTLKTGTSLAFDGTTETIGGLAGNGTVTLADGANLIFANVTNTSVFCGSINGTGTVTKIGSGMQCLWNTNTFSGTIRVDGGTLSVLGGGSPCTWFRFTIKRNLSDVNVTQLSELALYSSDGTRWDAGLKQGTATNALLQGQFATPVSYPTGSSSESTDKLFDNSTGTKWCLTANTPMPTNESSFRIVVMRLTNTISEIVSYNLCTANDVPGRDPIQWTMETSTDGVAWAEADARSGVVPPTDRYTWYNSGTPFTFTSRATGAGDTDVIPDSAVVEIGAGATLCVSNGTDVIGALLVDLSDGAGTLTQLTAKQNGTLYLENVSGAPQTWAIPLTLLSVTNPDVLKTWEVYADGVKLSGYTLSYDAATGTFVLRAKGTLLKIF